MENQLSLGLVSGFVLTLSLARLLQFTHQAFTPPKKYVFGWTHGIWMAGVVFVTIWPFVFTISEWNKSHDESGLITKIGFLGFYCAHYVATLILTPPTRDGELVNLDETFSIQRKLFYGMPLVLVFLPTIAYLGYEIFYGSKSDERTEGTATAYIVMSSLAILTPIIGMMMKPQVWHRLLGLFWFAEVAGLVVIVYYEL